MRCCLFLIVLFFLSPLRAETSTAPWLQVVRDTPYVFSAGLYDNLATIRRWVLLGESYCIESQRHLLFDQRGRFLTWFDNPGDVAANQIELNAVRERLYRDGEVHRWIAGSATETGYPFALRCDQPHVDLAASLDRLLGTTEEDRVWGTWDGITAGSPEQPWSLAEVVIEVMQTQAKRRGYDITPAMQRAFLGQILIESGARKRSFSAAQAVGLLQLRPEVLADCELAERFYLHRMAQVDCAVRLYQQNDRNLRPAFEQRFGDLPQLKRERLYSLLLVQAYHGGIGRMLALLGDGEEGRAGRELAADAERYSAEDLALGLVFHNLGRISLGLDSLYYSVDVAIAAEAVCNAEPGLCS
ncbi:hypothetical protein [Saccharospirillum mangrovi]|uniref:hypothetical protein n=1 Tax=Saccharospirillum mangrovi TaxID=2161747 RepID=UPI000D370D99|nr:hypothetical protein [Saccharospirillum mangrovi]